MANRRDEFSHTEWLCKYHIVFCPKYRRKMIYGQYRQAIVRIIRELCEWKGVEIIEAYACPDHIHLLVSIPPRLSVGSFMGYLKSKSAHRIFDEFPNLKYRFVNRQRKHLGGNNKKSQNLIVSNSDSKDVFTYTF